MWRERGVRYVEREREELEMREKGVRDEREGS